MADRPQDLIAQTDAQLVASGVPIAPRLNPNPTHPDPALGPTDPTAPLPTPAAPPDPAQIRANSPNAPAAPAPGLTPPDPAASFAKTQYDTTTSRTTGSSGLSADAQKRAGARLDDVGAKQAAATEADAVARQAKADADVRATEAAVQAAAERRREAAAEQAVNDRIQTDVDRRMQAAADWRPERKNMFGFGAGRGLAAAVAIIAGGWMQGRGQTATNQFLPFVMKMINDDVDDQVRKNSANIQLLREQKGDIKAAALELKKRQLMLVDSELSAKASAAAAKDPSVATAIEAFKAKSAAEQAAWDAEQRKSLERTVTEQVSRTTSPRQVVAGEPPKERSEAQAKAESASRAVDVLAEKAGLIFNPETGKYEVGKGALPPALLEKINPFSSGEIAAAADAAVEAFGRQQSGGVIDPIERPDFQRQLGADTTTREQLAARLNAARVNIDAKLKASDAAAREQQVKIPYQRVR